MSGLFKPPKVPDMPTIEVPPYVPPVATQPKEEVKEIIKTEEETTEAEKKKLKKGRERRGTLLTGPRGILTQPSVSYKTLLGD